MKIESMPSKESMKAAHRVRRFRRGNMAGAGRRYMAATSKPWKQHNPVKKVVA